MARQATFIDQLARYRLHLSFFASVALILKWLGNDGGRPYPIFSLQDIHPLAGTMLIAAGLLLRSWAAGVIHKNARLTMEGPYAWMRHPLYAGSFLVTMGFVGVMDDGVALVTMLILTAVVYLPTIRREERCLAERFGPGWADYSSRTPMLFPRFPLNRPGGRWQWRQWSCNREWRILLRTVALLWILEWVNGLTR